MEISNTHVETLLAEKERLFCGSVKVPICKLVAENLLTNPRQLDPKNIARLRNIFLLEGCHRLDPQNHIPVLIEQAIFDQALRRNNIPRSSLKSFDEPELLNLDGAIISRSSTFTVDIAWKRLKMFSGRMTNGGW